MCGYEKKVDSINHAEWWWWWWRWRWWGAVDGLGLAGSLLMATYVVVVVVVSVAVIVCCWLLDVCFWLPSVVGCLMLVCCLVVWLLSNLVLRREFATHHGLRRHLD